MNRYTLKNSAGSEEEDFNLEMQWVADVRTGDKAAFRRIFEKYYEALLCFACRYAHTNADAEEAVHDVFLWVWDKRESWSVEGKLKTYLYRAVKYQCIDLHRRKTTGEKYLEEHLQYQKSDAHFYEPQFEFDQENFECHVRKAVEELPGRARLIYKLSRTDGLTYKEIAEVLEISIKTVESQMSRALGILRYRLSKYLTLLLTFKKVLDTFI